MKDLESIIDTDGDGKISQEEIKKAIKVLKKAHLKKVKNKNRSNNDDQILSSKLIQENFI